MSEEEKEQWLYEEYKYTSNFDFNRLDKYEEANNDLCIDDLVLDYTMLYEYHKKEIERLKERIEDLNIINEEHRILNGMIRKELEVEKDISDGMLKTIDKAIEYLKENACIDEDGEYFCDDLRYDECKKLLDILKGSDKECLNCGEEKE